MRKLIVFVLVFLLSFSALYAQEQVDTSSLWNQAFEELNNLEDNSLQLRTIIDDLKSQSEQDKKLLNEQSLSLQQAVQVSTSLEASLHFYEKQSKVFRGLLVGAVLVAIGEGLIIAFR